MSTVLDEPIPPAGRRSGCPPLPVVRHPEPLWADADDLSDFADALAGQMSRHGNTAHKLHRVVISQGELTDRKTLSNGDEE